MPLPSYGCKPKETLLPVSFLSVKSVGDCRCKDIKNVRIIQAVVRIFCFFCSI